MEQRVWPQYILAFVCNLGTLSFGLHLGWMSPLQKKFQSAEDNPLGSDVGAFTLAEISWIGSIPTFALMIGPFIYGFCLQKFGRKLTLLIATVPNIVALIMLIFAKSLAVLYVARVLAGLAACIFIVVPIYVNECVEDSIRGLLGCLTGIFINVGIVIAYIFGNYTSYLVLNLVIMFFPVVFLLCYYWLPETPQYSATQGRREDAIKALQLLRGGSREKNEEIADEMMEANQRLINSREPETNFLSVFTDLVFLKGLGMMLTLFFIQQFSGINAVTAYSVSIFDEAKSAVSSELASVIMSLGDVVGAIIGTFLVDKYGRRMLLLYSNTVVAFSLTCLTIYLYCVSETPSDIVGYVPIVFFSLFVTAYSSGSGSVAYVLLPELFPPRNRPYASAICGCFISVVNFILLKFFPIVSEAISLAGTLTIFSSVEVAGVVFIYFFLFETKGKTTAEVMKKLGQKSEEVGEEQEKKEVLEPMMLTEDKELMKSVDE